MKMIAARTLLAPIAWGTTYVTVTELLPPGRPLLVAALRVVPAGLLLLVVGRISSSWRPAGADWGRTALLATCNFGLFFPLLIGAVYRLPGGVAAAAGGVQPLLVTAFSWAIVRRPPRRNEILVGAIAAVGVALIVVRPGAGLDAAGVLFALGANASFALGVVLTKQFPAPPNRAAATGWQLSMAGAVLLPVAVVVEGAPPHLTSANLGGFAYLSIAATGVAFLLWFEGIRVLPAPAPPLLGLAAPVTGAALGWLVLGQTLSTVQLLGFAVTLAAIARGAVLPDADPRLDRRHDRPLAVRPCVQGPKLRLD